MTQQQFRVEFRYTSTTVWRATSDRTFESYEDAELEKQHQIASSHGGADEGRCRIAVADVPEWVEAPDPVEEAIQRVSDALDARDRKYGGDLSPGIIDYDGNLLSAADIDIVLKALGKARKEQS